MQPVTCAALSLSLLVASCGVISRNPRTSSNSDGAGGESETGAVASRGGAAGQLGGGEAAQAHRIGDGGMDGSSEGGVAGAPTQVADPLVGQSDICDGYVRAWRTSEAQRESEETACFACLGYRERCFASRDAITEGQDACFRRHCLCAPTDPSCEASANACSCFGSCLPDAPSAIRKSWLDYMQCELEGCAAACNL